MDGLTRREQDSCQFRCLLRNPTQALECCGEASLSRSRRSWCFFPDRDTTTAQHVGATHKLAATAYHAAVMIAFLTRSQGGGRARWSRATTLFLRARVTAATRDCVSRLLRRSRRRRISPTDGSSTSAASPPVPAANMIGTAMNYSQKWGLQCGQSLAHGQHVSNLLSQGGHEVSSPRISGGKSKHTCNILLVLVVTIILFLYRV